MSVGIYLFAVIGLGVSVVVLGGALVGLGRRLWKWLRSTEFGQAVIPMHGVYPADRLVDVTKRHNERDDKKSTYHPKWVCIGTTKVSVGVLYIVKKRKPAPFDMERLKPRARTSDGA